MSLVIDHLRTERYDVSSEAAVLDRRLLKEAGSPRDKVLQTIWRTNDEGQRLHELYRFPQTLREAHLLFSHDRVRIIDTFNWLLSHAPLEGPIVDLGCGTGTLLRLLSRLDPDAKLVGVDEAPNLIAIARQVVGYPNIEWREAAYSAPLSGEFQTLISICGLEFPDQPKVLLDEEEGIREGHVVGRVEDWAATRLANTLDSWRRVALSSARLFVVCRLGTVAATAAFIGAAARAGWAFSFAASQRLRSGDELLPAMVFEVAEPHEWAEAQLLASWL